MLFLPFALFLNFILLKTKILFLIVVKYYKIYYLNYIKDIDQFYKYIHIVVQPSPHTPPELSHHLN